MTSRIMPLRRKLLAAMVFAQWSVPAVCAGFQTAGQAEQNDKKEEKEKPWMKTESGLKYHDIKEGTGKKPRKGQTCVVDYTVWLWVNGAKGKKCDSSKDQGRPFDFVLGQDPLIQGWVEGVSSMKAGGKRELIIPPDLGYGKRGAAGVIPPDATLFFELELKEVR
jgi:peptidylprolyl isomerase